MSNPSLCRVLLIDDDLLVLDDLQSMIDWEANGYCIVACAHNGKQALDIMAKESVDLIIADIEMPLMNGLDFLKQVHKIDNSIVALLLTAYSRFDYAREAVALGVFNYILKYELTPELLLNNLNQMRTLRINQQQNNKFNQHQMLLHVLENNGQCDPNEWNESNIDHKNIYLVKVNACFTLKQYEDIKHSESLAENVIENEGLIQFLPVQGIAYSSHEWEVTFIFTQPWDCYRLNQSLIDTILDLCQTSWKCNVQAIVTSCVSKSDVSSLYQSCKACEHLLFYCPLNHCMDLKDLHWMCQPSDTNYLNEFDQLESMDIAGVAMKLKQCLFLMKQNHMNIYHHYSNVRLLLRQLHRIMQHQLPSGLYVDDFDQWQEICNFDQLEQFVVTYLRQIENANGQSYSRKVVEMMNYIHSHCGQEDVLEALADYLGMNREYMAKLFKKETGESISNHLLNCRMKKAYQLLTHSHYKIYEIAEMCGYNSSQYFSMVFTKYYHCSPSDVMNSGNKR